MWLPIDWQPGRIVGRAAHVLLAGLLIQFAGCGSGSSGDGAAGPAKPSEDEPPRFTEATESAGIDFVQQLGEFGSYLLPEIMGGGVAMLDYDVDGDLDLFFVNGGTLPAPAGGAELPKDRQNRLYRQDDGGKFVDVTEGSGLEHPGPVGMGVAVGDVNNDGLPDLYLTNYGPDRLMLNTKEGVFVDVSEEAGIDNLRWSTAAAFCDVDQDGWLDLYVVNYLNYEPGRPCITRGVQEYCGPNPFPRTADILYRNLGGDDGKGEARARFADISQAAGINQNKGAGLGLICTDFNADGRLDFYVANDGHANFLWINQGDGTFSNEAVLLGAAFDRVGRGQGSMGVAIGDLNNDLQTDMVMTHVAGENNALYLSQGDFFEDGSVPKGISTSSFPNTGFGVVLIDLDHDGDLDMAVANGRIARNEDQLHLPDDATKNSPQAWAPYYEPNQLLINDGSGVFRLVASQDDDFLKGERMSRGLAAGDIDNDGDLDLVVTNIAGRARLLINEAKKSGSWLSVRAIEPQRGGRDAYGAWITLKAGDRSWRQHLNPSTSYLSSHDPRVHFGLGKVDAVDSIEVQWPDGSTEAFPGGPVNEFRELSRGSGESP